MIDRLEQQKKLTPNQWKLICTANVADLLDFFDFFLIGYVTAALTKEWSLTYWQGGAILLASGLGAVPGAFVWGWLGDKIGRRTVFIWSAVTISLATGIMVFTPGPDALVPGWLFLLFFRVFVGIGNAGIFTIDLPLVQEFIPAYKRGWVSALVTTLLPGGSMLAGLVAAWLLPIVGWRYLFLVGLSPLVLVFMIRYWVPESPRWLMRMGRHEEARRSLAWALMIDPKEIELPATVPPAGDDALARSVQVSAAGRRRLSDRADADRRGLARSVGRDAARHRAQHDAGARGVADGFCRPLRDHRPVLHHCADRASRPPRRGHPGLRAWRRLLLVLAGYFYDVFIGGWSLFYMLMVAESLLQQRDLYRRRAVHVRDLAGAAAVERHGVRATASAISAARSLDRPAWR